MWLSVTIIVPREFAEPLSDALLESGALSADISDADAGTADERPIFDEPGGAPATGWSRARVAALFEMGTDLPRALTAAFALAGADPATAYEIHRVEDDNWVRRTQAQFAPQRIAPRLWIVPPLSATEHDDTPVWSAAARAAAFQRRTEIAQSGHAV